MIRKDLFMQQILMILLLLFAWTASGATRKEDMTQDAALTEQALSRYGTFNTWSDALHPAREKFNRSGTDKVYSHNQFGNFLEAMKSVQKACEELGVDFMVVRNPSPAEKAFAAANNGLAPDPYIYLLQKLFADEKMELIEPLGPGRKPWAQRLNERYPKEEYSRKIKIEGELSLNLARTLFLPAVSKQLGTLAESINHMKSVGLKSGLNTLISMADRIGKLADSIETCAVRLEKNLTSGKPDKILEEMHKMRVNVDALEKLVDDDLWPLPKYREMLFIL